MVVPRPRPTTTTTPWPTLLSRPLTRVALVEAADCCLTQERRSLYAVHRPFAAGTGTPADLARLVGALVAAGLAEPHGRCVASLLLELLRKPLHPARGALTAWDLAADDAAALEARVVAEVVEALDPAAALGWLAEEVLGHSPRQAAERGIGGTFAVHAFMVEQLRQAGNGSSGSGPDGAAATPGSQLLFSPQLVASVASALFRTGNTARKQDALELLELAALSRLTERFKHVVLFDEHVAVQCAEAAATVGDSETVARLMFLLYRAKGALASPTLSEHAAKKKKRGGGGASGKRAGAAAVLYPSLRGTTGGDTPSASAAAAITASAPERRRRWWTGLWPFQQTHPQSPLQSGDGWREDQEALFESAAIRLLKSTIRAALYNSSTTTTTAEAIGGSPQLHEAHALFGALRTGTTWAGSAGMAVELLLFVTARQQENFTEAAAGTGTGVAPARLAADMADLQRCALKVLHAVLLDASHTAPSAEVHQDVVAYCVRLVMETFSRVEAVVGEEGEKRDGAATAAKVPLFLSLDSGTGVAAAQTALALFSLVTAPRHQEQLLPFALGAATVLFQVVARDGKGAQIPAVHSLAVVRGLPANVVHALFGKPPQGDGQAAAVPLSRLDAFFTSVQSPAHFIAATATAPGESVTTTAMSGALLLYLSLLTSDSHAVCAETMPLARRLDGGTAPQRQPGWFTMAGQPQRALLWGLLEFLAAACDRPPPAAGLQRQLSLSHGAQAALVRAARDVATRPSCDYVGGELQHLMRCLYAAGVQDSSGGGGAPCPLIDELLTRHLGFTVLTTTAQALARELADGAAVAKVSQAHVVVFVPAATLTKRGDLGLGLTTTTAAAAAMSSPRTSGSVGVLTRLVQRTIAPLVSSPREPAATLTVSFVLSGRAAIALGAIEARRATGPAAAGDAMLAEALLSALSQSAPPLSFDDDGGGGTSHTAVERSLFRVLVAGPPHLPPSRPAAQQGLFAQLSPANRDGVDDARGLARALADVAPNLLGARAGRQRVLVCLWNEDVGTVGARGAEAKALDGLLAPHHVQLLSVRRAQVEKSKRDISALLRASVAGEEAPLRGSAAGVAPRRRQTIPFIPTSSHLNSPAKGSGRAAPHRNS